MRLVAQVHEPQRLARRNRSLGPTSKLNVSSPSLVAIWSLPFWHENILFGRGACEKEPGHLSANRFVCPRVGSVSGSFAAEEIEFDSHIHFQVLFSLMRFFDNAQLCCSYLSCFSHTLFASTWTPPRPRVHPHLRYAAPSNSRRPLPRQSLAYRTPSTPHHGMRKPIHGANRGGGRGFPKAPWKKLLLTPRLRRPATGVRRITGIC